MVVFVKLTIILAAIMIAAFFAPFFIYEDVEAYYEGFGFSGAGLAGSPWTLVTSVFLHGNIEHLLSNLLGLLFFGFAVEKSIGWRMGLVFFSGAVLGDLFFVPFHGTEIISIGASAGVFSLIGFSVLGRVEAIGEGTAMVIHPLFLGMIYILYNIYGVFSGPSNIAFVAHFGGLAAGLAAGWIQKNGVTIMKEGRKK